MGADLSMPMAQTLTDMGLEVFYCIKPIILHRLTSIFVSSSHSFPFYLESNVKSDLNPKLPSMENSTACCIANIKGQLNKATTCNNERRMTQMKYNSASFVRLSTAN